MPRSTTFFKYQGLGNDFLVLDRRGDPVSLDPCVVRRLCDRGLGVGADGVLSLLPAAVEGADLRMEVQNADGSGAETCGNGLRCLAAHAMRELPELSGRTSLRIETGAGVREARLISADGAVSRLRVEMGSPNLEASEIPVLPPLPVEGRIVEQELDLGDRRVAITVLSVGNPHAVVFVEDPACWLPILGPRLCSHPAFPRGINVGAARITGAADLDLRVWERGVGPTRACGSGACAAAVAAMLTGRTESRSLEVRLPGGLLLVDSNEEIDRLWLTGPAVRVFEGSLDLGAFASDDEERIADVEGGARGGGTCPCSPEEHSSQRRLAPAATQGWSV